MGLGDRDWGLVSEGSRDGHTEIHHAEPSLRVSPLAMGGCLGDRVQVLNEDWNHRSEHVAGGGCPWTRYARLCTQKLNVDRSDCSGRGWPYGYAASKKRLFFENRLMGLFSEFFRISDPRMFETMPGSFSQFPVPLALSISDWSTLSLQFQILHYPLLIARPGDTPTSLRDGRYAPTVDTTATTNIAATPGK